MIVFKILRILKFIGRRLLYLLPQLMGVTIVVFLLVRLIPGNPAYVLLGQYEYYIRGLLQGNLGDSWFTSNPVLIDIIQKLPATLELITYSIIIIIVLSLFIAKVTAIRGNKIVNNILRGYGFLAGAFPDFWLSLIIIFLLFALVGIIPAPIGRLDISFIPPQRVTGFYTIDSLLELDFKKFANAWSHLFAPVLALVIVNGAPILKMAQATIIRTQKEEYIKFAKDNGLSDKFSERMIYRNSLPPVLTMIGYIYIFMLGSSVLVENIFSWGGMGQYAVQAITHSDYAPMQAIVLISAIISYIVYLVLDIVYYSIDPRVEI
ncbi:Dipeptide transport system permease protein DppB [subsurface metagenome]